MPKKKDAMPDGVRTTLRMTPEQRDVLRRAAMEEARAMHRPGFSGGFFCWVRL